MALRKAAGAAFAIWVLAGVAWADGKGWAEQFSRSVELPSHRWLETVRAAPDTALDEFTTDGCSGGMSSVWGYLAEQFPEFAAAYQEVPPWEDCCLIHDRAYHAAGYDPTPEASYDARLAADTVLQSCVARTVEDAEPVLEKLYGLTPEQEAQVYRAIALAMFQAVRLGGGPCTGLPWRWGYGWPQCWEQTGE
jgi:hypothetical protein